MSPPFYTRNRTGGAKLEKERQNYVLGTLRLPFVVWFSCYIAAVLLPALPGGLSACEHHAALASSFWGSQRYLNLLSRFAATCHCCCYLPLPPRPSAYYLQPPPPKTHHHPLHDATPSPPFVFSFSPYKSLKNASRSREFSSSCRRCRSSRMVACPLRGRGGVERDGGRRLCGLGVGITLGR